MQMLFVDTGGDLVFGDDDGTVVVDTGLACVLHIGSLNRNLIRDATGRLYACAVDKTSSHAWLFISDDGGATWSQNQADTTALTDYRNVDMEIDSDYNVHLLWNAYTGGNNKPYYRMWHRQNDAWDGNDELALLGSNWRASRCALTVNDSDEVLGVHAYSSSWHWGRRKPWTEGGAAFQEGSVDESIGLVSIGDEMHVYYGFSGNTYLDRTFQPGTPPTWSPDYGEGLFNTFWIAERMGAVVVDGIVHACAAQTRNTPIAMRHRMFVGGVWGTVSTMVAGTYDKVSVGYREGLVHCSFLDGTTIRIYSWSGAAWSLVDSIAGAHASNTPDIGYYQLPGVAHRCRGRRRGRGRRTS